MEAHFIKAQGAQEYEPTQSLLKQACVSQIVGSSAVTGTEVLEGALKRAMPEPQSHQAT